MKIIIRPMKAASVSRLRRRLSSFVVRRRIGPFPFVGWKPSTILVERERMYSNMSLPISMTVQSTKSSIILGTSKSDVMSILAHLMEG